jgi:flagellar M-ring protein FliF
MNSVTVKIRIASANETESPISEVQRQRVRPAGTIRRISVAVLVDGIATMGADGQEQWAERPAEELKALRDLVTAAVGYDESRGDVVTVESMQVRADATPGTLVDIPSWQRLLEANAMTLIQFGVLGIVVLVLALTVVRPILSRPPAVAPTVAAGAESLAGGVGGALPPPAGKPLDQISGPEGSAPDTELPALPGKSRSASPASSPSTSNETLRLAVTERPEQAAMMLREWLATDEGEAA